MKKLVILFLTFLASVSLWTVCSDKDVPVTVVEPKSDIVYLKKEKIANDFSPLPKATESIHNLPCNSPEPEPIKSDISQEDIELIALLTMAEAEGEPQEGQRLVIDTVLNRADFGGEFPSTIREVVYQKNQYSGMLSPRIDKCYVKEELVKLVKEELLNRTNYDVIFFRTNHYSTYGVPMFQVGSHYFSSYN